MGCNNGRCICTHLHVPAAHLGFAFCQPPPHSALSLWCLCPSRVPTIPLNVSDSSAPRSTISVYHTLLHLVFSTDKQWLKTNVKQCHSAHLLHSCKLWAPPSPSSCCVTTVETKGQEVRADKWCGPTGTSRHVNHSYCRPCKDKFIVLICLDSICYSLLK